MRSFGYALWLALPIALLALTYLSPHMDSWAHWALAIATLALTLWGAVRLTLNWQIQRILGAACTVVGIFVIRRFQGIARRIRARKEPVIVVPERPKVATRSIDLVRTHSRILNRGLTVIPGYSDNGKPISFDLAQYHTLIGSTTGGGKTNLMNSMLIQLFSKRRNKFLVHIIDLKGDRDDGMYKWGAVANVVGEINEALSLLDELDTEARLRHKQPERKQIPIVLFIDELARMTAGTLNEEHRQTAMRLLALLSEKARSARISIVAATQYPKYKILDTRISINFGRRICLPLKTKKQAEVVLGFSPSELPRSPGEFILSDGLKDYKGRTLQVFQDEIDDVIMRNISNFKDLRLQLWKDVAAAKQVGDTIIGINRLYEAKRPEYDLDFVRYGYRHLHYAGVLDPPVKGGAFRVKVSFLEGIPLIQQYIKAERWTGAPKPVVVN